MPVGPEQSPRSQIFINLCGDANTANPQTIFEQYFTQSSPDKQNQYKIDDLNDRYIDRQTGRFSKLINPIVGASESKIHRIGWEFQKQTMLQS